MASSHHRLQIPSTGYKMQRHRLKLFTVGCVYRCTEQIRGSGHHAQDDRLCGRNTHFRCCCYWVRLVSCRNLISFIPIRILYRTIAVILVCPGIRDAALCFKATQPLPGGANLNAFMACLHDSICPLNPGHSIPSFRWSIPFHSICPYHSGWGQYNGTSNRIPLVVPPSV